MTKVNFALPDVTLILDMEGVIRNAALSSAFADEGVDGWFGLPWADTVGDVGGDAVRRMVDDARETGASAVHEVTQRFPSGLELAVEYATLRLGGNAGLIAVGRNLQAVAELKSDMIAARRAIESDVWKLRDVATRYRLLFDLSKAPVLLIDAESLRIIESNAAAQQAIGVPVGHDLVPELAPSERDLFKAMLLQVRAQGKAPGIAVGIGPDATRWLARASIVASEPATIMVQFEALDAGFELSARRPVSIADLFEQMPEGFVVIDTKGLILRSNAAFQALLGSARSVIGEHLDRRLARPGADLATLLRGLQGSGLVGMFASTIRTDSGADVPVEISAASDFGGTQGIVGLIIRRLPATAGEETPGRGHETKGPDKAALRKLIGGAVANFERQCQEAAQDHGADQAIQPANRDRPERKLN